MADPAGNEFCVLDSLDRDTGPIASVVVDCADPRAMVRFWGKAMDWRGATVGNEPPELLRRVPYAGRDRVPHIAHTKAGNIANRLYSLLKWCARRDSNP